ncbi:Uncharacterized protein cmbei_2002380 [Cryptosporidium meleagridis]
MNTESSRFECFDVISRQGSKLSRTSFNTARTDFTIYYECDEFEESVENEIELPLDKSEGCFDFKKSVTTKFTEVVPRSKTRSTYISDAYCGFSNNCDKGKEYERIRSKTAPYRSNISGIISNTLFSDVFLIENNEDAFIDNSNLDSNKFNPKIKIIKKGNNFQSVNSQDSFVNYLNDNPPFINYIEFQVKENLYKSSEDTDENHEKKQPSFQKLCDLENNQLFKSFEVKLNSKRSIFETRQSYNATNQNLFNSNPQLIGSKPGTADFKLSIEKNKDFNNKLYVDLPTIFVEGETNINSKVSQSDCILSTFFNCKNICCLVD